MVSVSHIHTNTTLGGRPAISEWMVLIPCRRSCAVCIVYLTLESGGRKHYSPFLFFYWVGCMHPYHWGQTWSWNGRKRSTPFHSVCHPGGRSVVILIVYFVEHTFVHSWHLCRIAEWVWDWSIFGITCHDLDICESKPWCMIPRPQVLFRCKFGIRKHRNWGPDYGRFLLHHCVWVLFSYQEESI